MAGRIELPQVITPDDRGFTLGDGLFETVLAEAGELRSLGAHLDRMDQGCAVLGLPPPDRTQVGRLLREALAAANLQQARAAVRLTLTAGSGGRGLDRPQPLRPRLISTAAAAPRPTTPARLALVQVRRNDQSPAARLKTLAYLDNVLARSEAQARGADEGLMLNTRGHLACAAAANLFWSARGRLFTPALSCGALPGIMRSRVLQAAGGLGLQVVELTAGPEALAAADDVFLTNSLIGLRSVAALDGEVCQSGRLGLALAQALAAQ